MSARTASQGGSRRALALIVVVYVLAAAGTLAFALTFRSKMGLCQAQLLTDQMQLDEIAMAACAQACRALAADDDPNADSLADAWFGWHALEVPAGPGESGGSAWQVRWRLQDESARVNVNLAPADVLLKVQKLDETIVGSILDWIDTDDNPNPGGAEKEYYAGLSASYACRNGPIETVDELMFIKGITGEIYFGTARQNRTIDLNDLMAERAGTTNDDSDESLGLRDLLTVYGDGKINLNTALPAVLRAIPFLSEAAIDEILSRQRSRDKAFAKAEDIETNGNFVPVDKIVLQQVGRFRSDDFQLQVKIQPGGTSSVYEYTATIERDKEQTRVLNWQRGLPRVQQESLYATLNSNRSAGSTY